MKYCTKCGAGLPDEAAFCSSCGTAVQSGSAPVVESTPESEYFDPYVENYLKKGKTPVCGIVGLSLMLVAFVLEIVALASRNIFIYTAIALFFSLFILAAIVLAIVSLARGERKPCGVVTLSVIGGLMLLGILMAIGYKA